MATPDDIYTKLSATIQAIIIVPVFVYIINLSMINLYLYFGCFCSYSLHYVKIPQYLDIITVLQDIIKIFGY